MPRITAMATAALTPITLARGLEPGPRPVRAATPLMDGRERRRCRLALRRRLRERALVDQLEPVVAQLDDVAAVDALLADDADAVDVRPVVALQILDEPTLAVELEGRVVARDVAI